MLTLVYAQDQAGGIGYQNQLPWHLPNDLKFFKQVTLGHAILMGRKTFESMGCRLLPGRTCYVLTRQEDYMSEIEGLHRVHDLETIKALAQDQEVMVIGGAEIFAALLPLADRVIRTQIKATFPADTFVADLNQDQWQCVEIKEGLVDDKNHYAHQFEWWVRRSKEGKSC